ncbi:MAG: crossover junction endodeoxyribonuclease RuvC [Deltaproteobacteria bacterium]|nr:crossover junction endodeoxyribonuclease RuvC [Deltaproteobacteria bacterium]
MRILGIDPGSHITGYGVLEKRKNGIVVVRHGQIKTDKKEGFSACLARIYDRLMEVVSEEKPDAAAVEDIFYGKNVKSLIKQGHVRGVVLLVASHSHIPVFEYTPLEVKKAVVGYGRAEKHQVQQMVKTMLNLSNVLPEDASDALAVAICHAHTQKKTTL